MYLKITKVKLCYTGNLEIIAALVFYNEYYNALFYFYKIGRAHV